MMEESKIKRDFNLPRLEWSHDLTRHYLTRVMPGEDVNNDSIREMERASIWDFMEQAAPAYLRGKVLDYGCGDMPYKSLVEAVGGEYYPFDINSPDHPYPDPGFKPTTIMCNQVLQYVHSPSEVISNFRRELKDEWKDRYLVMTYPTSWNEVPGDQYDGHWDKWRFTKKGMEQLLNVAGFEILHHVRRAEVRLNGFTFPIGYGVVAQKIVQ